MAHTLNPNSIIQCPVCDTHECVEAPGYGDLNNLQCPRCGRYSISGTVSQIVLAQNLHIKSTLSHWIRQRQDAPSVVITSYTLTDIYGQTLPDPVQQIDILVQTIGSKQTDPFSPVQCTMPELAARVGMPINPANPLVAIYWLTTQEFTKTFMELTGSDGDNRFFRLTMPGWKRLAQLRESQPSRKMGFMAMRFSDEMHGIVATCFRPAIKLAGYDLLLLTDNQPAGLIDAQMRVALRSARFVVADVTDFNRGAYWEAGFAEGLGRPVIYTCRKDIWNAEDITKRPHFDTNHLVTIIWDPADLPKAGRELTALVRNTLPDATPPSEEELNAYAKSTS